MCNLPAHDDGKSVCYSGRFIDFILTLKEALGMDKERSTTCNSNF